MNEDIKHNTNSTQTAKEKLQTIHTNARKKKTMTKGLLNLKEHFKISILQNIRRPTIQKANEEKIKQKCEEMASMIFSICIEKLID